MNQYALTYPQLMGEIARCGFESRELTLLRRAYDMAEKMTDGLYRPSGASFLSHLIRTASITGRFAPTAPMMAAALLHASYSLGRLGWIGTRITRRAPRRLLRRAVGSEVERLVFGYDALVWDSPQAIRDHLQKLDGGSTLERSILLLRLANQLEDHLDGALAFMAAGAAHRQLLCAEACPDLALGLGHDELAEELEAALAGGRRCKPPAALKLDREFAYGVRTKNLPELAGLRRSLRAAVRRRRR